MSDKQQEARDAAEAILRPKSFRIGQRRSDLGGIRVESSAVNYWDSVQALADALGSRAQSAPVQDWSGVDVSTSPTLAAAARAAEFGITLSSAEAAYIAEAVIAASGLRGTPVQVSREDLAQLLNSHQLWGRLVADPDDWEDYASDDVRAAHLKTADAILTLLSRETVEAKDECL